MRIINPWQWFKEDRACVICAALPQHTAVSLRLTVACELELSGYAADFVLPETEA